MIIGNSVPSDEMLLRQFDITHAHSLKVIAEHPSIKETVAYITSLGNEIGILVGGLIKFKNIDDPKEIIEGAHLFADAVYATILRQSLGGAFNCPELLKQYERLKNVEINQSA